MNFIYFITRSTKGLKESANNTIYYFRSILAEHSLDWKCRYKNTSIDQWIQSSRCVAARSWSKGIADKRNCKITEAKGLTVRGRLGGVANSGIIWVNKVLVPRDCRPRVSWEIRATTLQRFRILREEPRWEVNLLFHLPLNDRARPCLSFPLGKSRWIFFNLVRLPLPRVSFPRESHFNRSSSPVFLTRSYLIGLNGNLLRRGAEGRIFKRIKYKI